MEKTTGMLRKLMALLLVSSMLLGMAACGRIPEQLYNDDVVPAPSEKQENSVIDSFKDTINNISGDQTKPTEEPEVTLPISGDNGYQEIVQSEADSDTWKEILAALGNDSSEDLEDMDDEEIEEKVNDLIEDLIGEPEEPEEEAPPVEVEPDPGAYNDDGAMTDPFDQVYPELVESGAVKYDDETLLVKMHNSYNGKVTDGMAAAGVAALEVIVPMDETSWYEAKLVDGTDATAAIEALRQLKEIMVAEYNYEIRTSQIDAYTDWKTDRGFDKNGHHGDQWYMHHCGIPDGMEEMETDGGDPSVIVAVIDTGVDYDHEDLAQNIWVNENEIPDDGIDNDQNGYVDDYYGVNIVAGTGNGDDDNGHGTHVAGIIAAQNNNLGTVGIAYNVKIMPVKAAMASGFLHQSDIAKAVLYAYEHGAEVINMSFGGTACSIAVQDALAVAYTRCVLVASAGNDGMNNEPTPTSPIYLPNYPAALTYVLGVMSVDSRGVESTFTNWDVKAFNGVEYELYAPGDGIMSTLPNNRYGILSGTSMAAPVVSAIAAILRSEFSDRNMYPTKFIYGQLSSTSGYNATCLNPDLHGKHNLPQIVNLYSALTKLPKPEVNLQDHALFDTKGFQQDVNGANTGEGVIDAGETIALGLTLRNRWGMSKDTIVKIDTLSLAGIPDPYITILNDTVNYDSVGTYSTKDNGKIYTDGIITGWEDPFYIRIAENCPNDYIFKVNVTITCGNALDEKDTATYTTYGTVYLEVRNGTVVPSVISEDAVWTADNLYIIPNATVIEEGVTVRVEPGTKIQFWTSDEEDPYSDNYIAYLRVDGNFIVEGTKENPVQIYPSDLMDNYLVEFGEGNHGMILLKHAQIRNFNRNGNASSTNYISYAYNCEFTNNYSISKYRCLEGGMVREYDVWRVDYGNFGDARYCSFYRSGNYANRSFIGGRLNGCIFADMGIDLSNAYMDSCVLLGNYYYDLTEPGYGMNTTKILRSQMKEPIESNDILLFYRPETGTTYAAIYNYTEEIPEYIKALNGDYAAFEDEAEFSWLKHRLPDKRSEGYLSYNLGIRYDAGQMCYVWSNGEPVEIFNLPELPVRDRYLLIEGVMGTDISKHKDHYQYCGAHHTYQLFEIPGEIYLTDLTMRDYEILLDMDSEYLINVNSLPVNVPAEELIFESRNTDVVTVDASGLITPTGLGSTDVYIYSKDRGVYNYISVTVKEYKALESIAFSAEYAEVAAGETLDVSCLLTPVDTTRRSLSYVSSDPAIAEVDRYGRVTGVASGEVTITATSKETDEEGNPISAQMTLKVYNKATSLDINTIVITAMLEDGTIELPSVVASADAETACVWRALDPTVADIQDGTIVLKTSGSTTLEVTDSRSGLAANCMLLIRDTESVAIRKVSVWESRHYVLTEDNVLYHWNANDLTKPYVLTNVLDVSLGGSYTWLLREQDVDEAAVLERWYFDTSDPCIHLSVTTGFLPEEISKIASYDESVFFTANGSTYAYGRNNAGHLGVGFTGNVEEPTLVNLEGIADIVTWYEITFFLTDAGELYYSGGGKTDFPVFICDGVAQIFCEYGSLTFVTRDGKYKSVSIGEGLSITEIATLPDADYIDAYSSSVVAIKDGIVYYTVGRMDNSAYIYEFSPVPGIYNAVSAEVYGGTFYVVTADDLLLAFGDNSKSSNHMLGASDEVNVVRPVVVPFYSLTGSKVALLESNLGLENILSEEDLLLTFNKHILKQAPRLFADGKQIAVTSAVENLNQIRISKANGFEEGKTYEVVFQVGALQGELGTTNDAEIRVAFTFEASDTSVPEDGSEEEIFMPVVHKTVRDESVFRFYWTSEELAKQLTEKEAQLQLNSLFIRNAILNRFSLDTDVSRWFRVQGCETTSRLDIPVGGNYWGTTSEDVIGMQIIDYTDFPNYAKLIYSPFLTEAPENTFPFVTSLTVSNKDGEEVRVVGNEEITVRITFNRDMNTEIPLLVRFGSAYPYGDYEIPGKYTDARTWVGVYTLTTIIENGNQAFTISNGCSAEDGLDLFTDMGRFGFEIDTTAAQALIMQGNATDTGIQLTWTQDDFETLMGYNVYRSTSEDGFYQRINQTVIPAEQMEFFDDTVEPGVQYYYNFTVVKTDLSESVPSGKITIMSKDTMAPNIYHSPVYQAFTGQNLIISATVTDNLNIFYTDVYYRTVGADQWKVVRMNNLNDKYSAIIPASEVTTAGIAYYLDAFDGVSHTYLGSAQTPYVIEIREAISQNALGDVNNDGMITNYDALLLLYAINDKYNMTAEEFARADLNGDGVLRAAEALRILQYVSGEVGSVVMP